MVRCGAEGPWSCPAHRLRGLSQHQSFQNFANRSGAKAVYRAVVTELMKAFRKALVHDLDADGFADMYAQTIAYGLLSARIANPKANTSDDLTVQMPVTNPFLRELMETFLQVGGRRGETAAGASLDFDELGG